MVTALVLLFRLRAAEADQRVRTDLLADLLAPTARRTAATADRGLVERGRLLGLRLHAPHVLVVCRPAAGRGGLLLAAAQAGAGARAGRGARRRRGRAGAGPRPRAWPPPSAARAPAGTVGGPVTVGRGRAGRARCTGCARRTPRPRGSPRRCWRWACAGTAARWPTWASPGWWPATAPDVDGYLDRVLGPVLNYDQRRGTDLVGTLEAYFACGASPRRAAGQLHVHVNTVAQRLDRIAALLGADWQRPDRALELQLALRLRRLRRA